LGNRRLRYEERAGDLISGQATQESQGQGDTGFTGENGMAGDEHQTQQIVAHRIIDGSIEVGPVLLQGLEIVDHFDVLPVEHLATPQDVDGPVLRGRHEPRTRLVRNPGSRPPLQRSNQRILRQVLGQPDIAHDPGQPGNEPG
jgi:hypothetical protein